MLSVPKNDNLWFVKRSVNRVAHYLARVSRLNAGCVYSPIWYRMNDVQVAVLQDLS